MQAIREIRDVFSEELTLKVPKEFIKKRVEIIILPVDESWKEEIQSNGKFEFEEELEKLSWNMGEKFCTTRDQLHER